MSENAVVTMSADQYHSDPCPSPSLSNSVANVLLARSPYHAWMAHPKLNPAYRSDESSRFDLGSAAHAILLEGDSTKICIVDAADWRTKTAKEQRDTARANGLLPILAKHDFAVKAMVLKARAFIEQSELAGIFTEGKPEQTLTWQEPGIWCRSRLDWLTNDHQVILDYKTTDSAEPEAFIRQIGRMGYDLQTAFYSRAVHMAGKCKTPTFVFLVQEVELPYACSLVGLSSAYNEIAQAKYLQATQTWRECLEANKWPAYPSVVCYAEPPVWAMKEHEEDLLHPFDKEEQ